MIFVCSHCSKELKCEDALVGQLIDCTSCGETIEIPNKAPAKKIRTTGPKMEFKELPEVPPVRTANESTELLRNVNDNISKIEGYVRLFYIFAVIDIIFNVINFIWRMFS